VKDKLSHFVKTRRGPWGFQKTTKEKNKKNKDFAKKAEKDRTMAGCGIEQSYSKDGGEGTRLLPPWKDGQKHAPQKGPRREVSFYPKREPTTL